MKKNPLFNFDKIDGVFILRVLLKTALLFLVLNLLFAWIFPMQALGKLSGYNRFFPGHSRLPFGENPSTAYNLSLNNLPAMFSSHLIDAAPKAEDEFRVILLGDSSVWGYWLENDETLSAQLNLQNLDTPDGKRIVFYNLGYPTISLTKDLMLMEQALPYEPDMILWLVTLESFPQEKQLFTPLVQENPQVVQPLLEQVGLRFANSSDAFHILTFREKSILGQRRELADLLRLQFYGILWAATGVDQDIPQYADPQDYKTRAENLEADDSFHNLNDPLTRTSLAFDVLSAGAKLAGETPLVIVNEPMYISQGENSDVRYNFFYPRWAYDEYRMLMQEISQENSWTYIDLWNSVPAEEFTNSAIHLTPAGSRILAEKLAAELWKITP